MAITLPPQLTDIAVELTAQEAAITAELAELIAKREALQSVIQLFDPSSASETEAPVIKPATTKKAAAKKPTSKKTTPAKKVTTSRR